MFRHAAKTSAAAVAIAGLTLTMSAPTASATFTVVGNGYSASSCSGTQIDAGRVYAGIERHPTAIWRLYRGSDRNGVFSCLKLWDNEAGSHYMTAAIRPYNNYHSGAKDEGTFSTYAGAVGIRKTPCIGFSLTLRHDGKTYVRDVPRYKC